MQKPLIISFFLIIFISFLFSCSGDKLPHAVIETGMGKIEIVVDTVRAPVTARNFIGLTEKGIYRNSKFYRVVRPDNQPQNNVKIEVIQGGLFDDSEIEKYPPIRHETTKETRIKHRDGVISMARYTPGTASTEFFICVGEQPSLDFGGNRNPDKQGFAAFGHVVSGMDIIKKIQQLPDTGQYLVHPVIIKNIVLK